MYSNKKKQVHFYLWIFQKSIHVPLCFFSVTFGLGHVLQHSLIVRIGIEDALEERFGTGTIEGSDRSIRASGFFFGDVCGPATQQMVSNEKKRARCDY